MATETVVAVFDTAAHAQTAIADLIANGVPVSSIEHYARDAETAGVNTASSDVETHGHRGFWAWLTGEQETTQAHHALYDQTIQSGGTVVTVISDGTNIDQIYHVLETHNPVDLDERHSQYNETGAYGALGATAGATTGLTATAPAQSGQSREEVISLSEESLQVGKREVDRGTTRVRRYVVERPVEEQIRLRNETVSVFRRPVTAATTVGADAFTDREIVVTETDEEAVVAKSAHVVEEVVVQKGVEEHVETIRDTLRREEVEIDGPTTTTAAGVAGVKPTTPRI
jgi:uncharacterized protein (TIGR02271 family)